MQKKCNFATLLPEYETMLKFLLYLFLFYVLYRLIVGRVTGTTFKTKVYRFDTHHHHHHKPEKEPEGTVTVNPKIKDTRKTESSKIGEYVDYEEVK
jgi:hypothetical protein